MEARVQRILIWCGPAMLLVWLLAFIFLAGFIPPSDPMLTPEQVVTIYSQNTFMVRFGLVVAMFGSALLVPYAVAISGQLKRIDGAKALADTQMVSCALLSLEFIVPIAVWISISYRFDGHAAEIVRALHDLGWILFMTVIWSLWIQLVCIGAAILIDRKPKPTYPRWLAYVNFMTSLAIIPAGLVLFFKDGPFAWNGLFGIYVPILFFAIWFASMAWTTHRNLTAQIAEGSVPG